MNVMLNGATAGTNFGDFLFAHMFQKRVSSLVGEDNVYWYCGKCAMSDFFESHLENHKHANIKDMGALIYISGGYFCGNDKTFKDRLFRVLRYFVVGIKAIKHRIPYAIIGLEVADPKNWWLKKIEKYILKNASLLIVRNRESMDCLNDYGISGAIESVDSAFAIDHSLFEDKAIPSQIQNCAKKILLLHVNPYRSSNVTLEKKVIPIVNAFLKKHSDYSVLVTADQYSDIQNEILENICDKLECEEKIKYTYEDPIALCKVINCVDTIVTHKLHVGIVGARLGKSVISFSGHTEKIQRLYRQLNEAERSVALSSLTFEQGVEIMEKYYDKPIHVEQKMIERAKSNFLNLDNFLRNIKGDSVL